MAFENLKIEDFQVSNKKLLNPSDFQSGSKASNIDYFINKSIEFKENNFKSIEICNKIEVYLYGMGLVSLIPIINSLSLCIEMPKNYSQKNSTFFISPRCSAKSTILKDIIAKSNPEWFVILNKKIFESSLLKKGAEYFNNKVLVHDDLIVALTGLNTKQREQLAGFLTHMLAEGCYSRDEFKILNVNCIGMFGMAKESYYKHKTDFIDLTLFDRAIRYEFKYSDDYKGEVIDFMDNNLNRELPIIKLPFTKEKVKITLNLSRELALKRKKLAMELNDYGVVSVPRSVYFIDIFMLCNAHLNNRKHINEFDFQLYEMLHQFFIESTGELNKEIKVKTTLNKYPGSNGYKLAEITGLKPRNVYNILKRLKNRGDIKDFS